MFNFNEVTLIGQLGQDPKIIKAKNNDLSFVVCQIATNETWNYEKKTENHVEWHTVEISQPRARFIAEHAKKGNQLFVRGHLRTREWEDSEKRKQHQTVIKANQVHLLRQKTGSAEDVLPLDENDVGHESTDQV